MSSSALVGLQKQSLLCLDSGENTEFGVEGLGFTWTLKKPTFFFVWGGEGPYDFLVENHKRAGYSGSR